jgi:SAM-dependent methyltransferase
VVEWWQTFFDENYLAAGLLPIKPRKTHADVRFIRKALPLKKGARILDVCCGIGRHTLGLSKLGYRATGVDFSEKYVELARGRARKRGLAAKFERHDLRRLPYKGRFDAAICMWTSFGYFEKDGDDLKALRSVHRALKRGGVFLMELINRDWLVANFEPLGWTELKNGYLLEKRRMDTRRSRIHGDWTYVLDGAVIHKNISLRVYSVHELVARMEKAGFRVLKLYGDREERSPTLRDRMTAIVASG